MHVTAFIVLLGACGLSVVCGCEVTSINDMVQRIIDENLDHLRSSGELCHMGMKSHYIPNSAITASSYWGNQQRYEPHHARLDNFERGDDSTGAWSSGANHIGEWLQVDFGNKKAVAGVITQGRPTYHNQWVRSYKISCGTDQENLTVVEGADGQEKVFTGNVNMETKVYNRFPQILHCRYIRIYPQTWHSHMSMRVEFIHGACFENPHVG